MPSSRPSPASDQRRRRAPRGVIALAALIALPLGLGLTLRLRYGGGEPYPDLTQAPLLPEAMLEVAAVSQEPIGNIAVSRTGRLFFTIHPESHPTGAKLLEWVEGKPRPYPSEEAQRTRFQTVLGLAIDRQDRLWTIDHGDHGTGQARLLAFNLSSGEVVHEHVFTREVAQLGSFLQDLQVDSKGETVYIADVSFFRKNPGLVVYDVATKTARRVLESHPAVFPQDWIIRNPIKDMVFLGGLLALKAGVDGIAIDRRDEWVYFGAMNHDTLYRVRAADLRNAALGASELGARVQAVGRKPLNDGLSTDNEGNVLVTDVEHSAVVRMRPDGKLETLIKTPRIRWADALKYGPEGWLYVADSAIPHQMLQSRAHITANAPYHVYRFKPGIDGVPGQ